MPRSSILSKDRTKAFIPFGVLGRYCLHVYQVSKEQSFEYTPFTCSVYSQEELRTEVIELSLGEELHADSEEGERPLIRFNEDGLWAWVQDVWLPVKRFKVRLELDPAGYPRVKFVAK